MRFAWLRNLINQVGAVITSVFITPWLSPLIFGLFLIVMTRNWLKMTRTLSWTRKKDHLKRFAGPRAYPVIGNMIDILFIDFHEWSKLMFKRWGDPLRLWIFGHPVLLIGSYKYAMQLWTKSRLNGKLHGQACQGGKGDNHPQKMKLLIINVFSQQSVETFNPIFCDETVKLVRKLDIYANNGQIFNIVDDIMLCLFRMVARSNFGDTFLNTNENGEMETKAIHFMNALYKIMKNSSTRILSPHHWQLKDYYFYFNLTTEAIENRTAQKFVNRVARQAIRKRRDYLKAFSTSQNRTNPSHQRDCYIDILLDLVKRGQLSDGDITELNNFMGGSYISTSLTVSWTLLLLSLNHRHQKRCFKQFSRIFSDCRGPSDIPVLTAAHTKQMTYVELCLKESVRLFPSQPVLLQSTQNDIKLDDGRVIPGDVDVIILADLINRDPKYFPDPDSFVPERHINNMDTSLPTSLSSDYRQCFVENYGMHLAKIVMAYMVMFYEWEAAPGTGTPTANDRKIAYKGLMCPVDGIYLKIRKRNRLHLSKL